MTEPDYLAHSARNGFPAQSYACHVANVYDAALENASGAAAYAALDGELLTHVVSSAAAIHDLGKLLRENQAALQQENNLAPLPINHIDAGVALLKRLDPSSSFSQVAVCSHHGGLPNLAAEENRKENCFRNGSQEIRRRIDTELPELFRLHKHLTPAIAPLLNEGEAQGDAGVLLRLMLSCLADADHSDTARHYGKQPLSTKKEPRLRPEERLEQLNAYVESLGKASGPDRTSVDERSRLRSEMYLECRDNSVSASIVACDSPVGSGKTTAVMAHLLRQAIRQKARRIFVVLPFTNIIKQSVDVYRKALLLPGENPEEVVAALHHRADFENEDMRILTAQWRAPIIVTTAVAFFETLASNRPSALRRLHELPGSVIFVDEAHAALPVKLLPVTWSWMRTFADEWSCHWVLASGSLVRFWELDSDEWERDGRTVPDLVSAPLRERLHQYETHRIRFAYEPRPLSRSALLERVISAPGPRLLIMNTVQNAAVMAQDLRDYYREEREEKVMHLSTALNAVDREAKIDRIKARLDDPNDTDWTLVATSCVEAGVDFSFRTGFRELSSLLSLLQAAGRINRNGKNQGAVIWSFTMQDDAMLSKNPGVAISSQVLLRFFQNGYEIQPALSTLAVQQELDQSAADLTRILNAEFDYDFPEVDKLYRVIEGETVLAIADPKLKEQIRYGGADWKAIQEKALSLRKNQVGRLSLEYLAEGIWDWSLGYDTFLGYMAGLLPYLKQKDGFLTV